MISDFRTKFFIIYRIVPFGQHGLKGYLQKQQNSPTVFFGIDGLATFLNVDRSVIYRKLDGGTGIVNDFYIKEVFNGTDFTTTDKGIQFERMPPREVKLDGGEYNPRYRLYDQSGNPVRDISFKDWHLGLSIPQLLGTGILDVSLTSLKRRLQGSRKNAVAFGEFWVRQVDNEYPSAIKLPHADGSMHHCKAHHFDGHRKGVNVPVTELSQIANVPGKPKQSSICPHCAISPSLVNCLIALRENNCVEVVTGFLESDLILPPVNNLLHSTVMLRLRELLNPCDYDYKVSFLYPANVNAYSPAPIAFDNVVYGSVGEATVIYATEYPDLPVEEWYGIITEDSTKYQNSVHIPVQIELEDVHHRDVLLQYLEWMWSHKL